MKEVRIGPWTVGVARRWPHGAAGWLVALLAPVLGLLFVWSGVPAWAAFSSAVILTVLVKAVVVGRGG